jgi:hypothetical protein
MKSIVETYNNGQDRFVIDHIDKYTVWYYEDGEYYNTGKYEFIGNPEYKVIETLAKDKETMELFYERYKDIEFLKQFLDLLKYDYCFDCKKDMIKQSNVIYRCDTCNTLRVLKNIDDSNDNRMLQGYWQEYILERIKA